MLRTTPRRAAFALAALTASALPGAADAPSGVGTASTSLIAVSASVDDVGQVDLLDLVTRATNDPAGSAHARLVGARVAGVEHGVVEARSDGSTQVPSSPLAVGLGPLSGSIGASFLRAEARDGAAIASLGATPFTLQAPGLPGGVSGSVSVTSDVSSTVASAVQRVRVDGITIGLGDLLPRDVLGQLPLDSVLALVAALPATLPPDAGAARDLVVSTVARVIAELERVTHLGVDLRQVTELLTAVRAELAAATADLDGARASLAATERTADDLAVLAGAALAELEASTDALAAVLATLPSANGAPSGGSSGSGGGSTDPVGGIGSLLDPVTSGVLGSGALGTLTSTTLPAPSTLSAVCTTDPADVAACLAAAIEEAETLLSSATAAGAGGTAVSPVAQDVADATSTLIAVLDAQSAVDDATALVDVLASTVAELDRAVAQLRSRVTSLFETIAAALPALSSIGADLEAAVATLRLVLPATLDQLAAAELVDIAPIDLGMSVVATATGSHTQLVCSAGRVRVAGVETPGGTCDAPSRAGLGLPLRDLLGALPGVALGEVTLELFPDVIERRSSRGGVHDASATVTALRLRVPSVQLDPSGLTAGPLAALDLGSAALTEALVASLRGLGVDDAILSAIDAGTGTATDLVGALDAVVVTTTSAAQVVAGMDTLRLLEATLAQLRATLPAGSGLGAIRTPGIDIVVDPTAAVRFVAADAGAPDVPVGGDLVDTPLVPGGEVPAAPIGVVVPAPSAPSGPTAPAGPGGRAPTASPQAATPDDPPAGPVATPAGAPGPDAPALPRTGGGVALGAFAVLAAAGLRRRAC